MNMSMCNPNDLCRICLTSKDLSNLFQSPEDYKIISNKITQIANIKISEDDKLPNNICINCKQKVDNFYQFKCLIERSDKYLRSIINHYLPYNAKSNTIEFNHHKITENKLLLENLNEIEKNTKIILPRNSQDENCFNDIEINTQQISNKFPNKSKFQCYLCGILLTSNHSLKKHIKIHNGEKPFDCIICKKSFTTAFNLKIHERIHTGEKPLQCKLCPMKFSQPASLGSHQRNHSGEVPYKCHLCPRIFKSNSSLKYHIVTHTGEKKYSCSLCKRDFIRKSDLKNHEKTHSDEKPFICSICGLRLRRAYGLKRHIESHNGTKNYKCDLCHISFLQKYDLKRHRNTHFKKKIDNINNEKEEN